MGDAVGGSKAVAALVLVFASTFAEPALAKEPEPPLVQVLDEGCVTARFGACTQLVDTEEKNTAVFVFWESSCPDPTSWPWPAQFRRSRLVPDRCGYVGLPHGNRECAKNTHAMFSIPGNGTRFCALRLEQGWRMPDSYAGCEAWARQGPGRDACLRNARTEDGLVAKFKDFMQATLHAVCKATNQDNCPELPKPAK
jgi:hypothetical protein